MPKAATVSPRDHLVATARLVLDDHGLEGLTLRQIARQGGCSHGAPLRHFPSLAALLATVAAQGFRELFAAIHAATAAVRSRTTARARLAAAGRAYVRFAHANPGVFGLMFRPERLDMTDPDYLAAGHAAFNQLRGLCAAAQREGMSPKVRTDHLAAVVWAAVHGLSQLSLHGALGVLSNDATNVDAIQDVLNQLLLQVPRKRRSSR